MAGREELVPADDGEAHQVVVDVGDPLGLHLAGSRAPQAAVGGDAQALVGGVDAKAVHVLRPGVGDGALATGRQVGLVVAPAAGNERGGTAVKVRRSRGISWQR
jgi:hypothetical protein